MAQTWLVTGSSVGLGRSIVEAALAAGHSVVATARKPDALRDLEAQHSERLLTLSLDVTSASDWERAIDEATRRFGGVDVLVNNAGYGIVGALEDTSIERLDALFRTNVHGTVLAAKAVLPSMRERGSGRIILISSVGARIATAGAGFYYASKAAVSALAESLALEVAPLGIHVTVVEPGAMRTRFAEPASLEIVPASAAYEGTVGATAAMMQSADYAAVLQDPAGHARLILEIAQLPEPPVRILAGADAFAMGTGADQQRAAVDAQWSMLSQLAPQG